MLSKDPHINSKQISTFLGQRNIPGLRLNVNREITENDIIRFSFTFPELNYFSNDIEDDENMQKKIQKEVLKPYLKYIKKHGNTLYENISNAPLEIPKEILKKMEQIIKTNNPNGYNPQVVAEYYIYNILNLNSRAMQEQVLNYNSMQLTTTDNNLLKRLFNSVFQRNKPEMENLIMLTSALSNNNIGNIYERLKKLESIISGISSQLYMNSRTIKDKTPEQIEEILKTGYSLYTEREANDTTYIQDEYGYRTVNVGLGKSDVLLHRDGDNIKRAMVNLTTDVKKLIENEPNLSEDEYLKKAAMLHFRYISIHPFRDSNGRTGRNIINMLLAQKNKMFVLNRSDKDIYSRTMNEMRNNIPLEQYLDSLAENPEECAKYEETYCGKLTKFIKSHTSPIYRNIENTQYGKTERLGIEKTEDLGDRSL